MTDNQTEILSLERRSSPSNRKYNIVENHDDCYQTSDEDHHLKNKNDDEPSSTKQLILIKNIKYRRIFAIIGCILIHLCLGSIYTFGNMLPYIASYISSDANQYEYYSNICTYIYAFAMCSHGIFTPIGGKLEQSLGPQLTIFIGGTIFASAVALTFFSCANIFLLYLTYGFLFGAGIGIAYPCCLVCAMKWYPNKKGKINGIVLAGYGCSALIFDRIQTSFINPNNIAIDSSIGFIGDEQLLARVPYCFLLLGCIFFVMIVIGTLLINDPPLENGIRTENDDENVPLLHLYGNEIEIEEEFNVQQVLKSIKFWHLYLCFFVDGLVIVFIATQWKEYSTGYLNITDDSMLSNIGAIAALFNGFGRIFWGFVLDKTQSFRVTLGLINILLVVLLFVWPLLKSMSVLVVYLEVIDLAFVALLFGLICGNFVIFPTAITWIFGVKNNGVNLGLLFTSQILCAFAGVYALDLFLGYVGWRYITWFMGSIQVVGFVVAVTFPK